MSQPRAANLHNKVYNDYAPILAFVVGILLKSLYDIIVEHTETLLGSTSLTDQCWNCSKALFQTVCSGLTNFVVMLRKLVYYYQRYVTLHRRFNSRSKILSLLQIQPWNQSIDVRWLIVQKCSWGLFRTARAKLLTSHVLRVMSSP